jgi:hypothetical protein
MRPERSAFARSEVLVPLALGAVLLGLLLPGVQKARAASARATCTDNLKQIGLALHNYESAHGELPPSATDATGTRRSWAIDVLPHLGQERLFKQYRPDLEWFDPANQTVINTHLAVFQCPQAQNPRTAVGAEGDVNWKGATSDYVVHGGLDGSVVTGMGVPREFERRGMMRDREPTRLAEVTDGLSSSLLVSESAGRPEHWIFGKKVGTMPMTDYGVWGSRQHKVSLHGHAEDGKTYPGPCAINCTNWRGLYSFHTGYINTCFGDSSVRTLKEGMNVYVLYSLITTRGGEVIASQDY